MQSSGPDNGGGETGDVVNHDHPPVSLAILSVKTAFHKIGQRFYFNIPFSFQNFSAPGWNGVTMLVAPVFKRIFLKVFFCPYMC